jgi:hypothetical protein
MPRTTILALALCALGLAGGDAVARDAMEVVERPISIQPDSYTLGTPFDIKLGQTVSFADAPLALTFNDVTEDSRCPTGVSCVWAGRFIAAMTLTRQGAAEQFKLSLDKPVSVHGYSVQLSAALPAPGKDGAPDLDDYVLTVTLLAD